MKSGALSGLVTPEPNRLEYQGQAADFLESEAKLI
jgi:hypothetical protein